MFLRGAFNLLITLCVCDLPIHCELENLLGQWSFSVSRIGAESKAPQYPIDMNSARAFCGVEVGRPTQNSDLISQNSGSLLSSLSLGSTFDVYLTQTQEVVASMANYARHRLLAYPASEPTERGYWTGVFDQGWELRLGNRSYLAFSKYTCAAGYPESSCMDNNNAHENPDGSVVGWKSECGDTFVGWFHETDENELVTGLGCFHAKRLGDGPSELMDKPVAISLAEKLKLSLRRHETSASFLEGWDSAPTACNIDAGIEDQSAEPLPESFDWREQFKNIAWDTPITEQGSCGSCYAVAGTYALQSRANILLLRAGISDPSFLADLSVQSVVSCSWYNQGCNGGLEVLVHRHSIELGVPPSTCMRYSSGRTAQDGQCDATCFNDESQLVFAKDYGYMGGFHGLCSEQRMMRDLYDNGPLTVAVNVKNAKIGKFDLAASSAPSNADEDSDTIGVRLKGRNMQSVVTDLISSDVMRKFLSDRGPEVSSDGKSAVLFIRARSVQKNWKNFVDAFNEALALKSRANIVITDAFSVGVHGWQYIDHSVVVVGWGEELDQSTGRKQPYWIIRNSWNADIEFGGYTKVRRGANVGAVESASVWVTPDPCRGKIAASLKAKGVLHQYCSSAF